MTETYKIIKDTHSEKARSNKTPAFTKSTNMGILVQNFQIVT